MSCITIIMLNRGGIQRMNLFNFMLFLISLLVSACAHDQGVTFDKKTGERIEVIQLGPADINKQEFKGFSKDILLSIKKMTQKNKPSVLHYSLQTRVLFGVNEYYKPGYIGVHPERDMDLWVDGTHYSLPLIVETIAEESSKGVLTKRAVLTGAFELPVEVLKAMRGAQRITFVIYSDHKITDFPGAFSLNNVRSLKNISLN